MKYLTYLIIGFILVSCKSVDKKSKDRKEVQKILEGYLNCIVKEDFDCMYNFTHPISFLGSTKKEVIEDIKDGIHNRLYDMQMKNAIIDSMSEIYTYKLNKYALVRTQVNVFVILNKNNKDSIRYLLDQYCSTFKEMYGDSNVKCDTLNKTLNINAKNFSFVIYDYVLKGWYMLTVNNQKNIEKIIPEGVRNILHYSPILQ